MSSTWVTPPAQATSSSLPRKIGTKVCTSALWTSPIVGSLLAKMSPGRISRVVLVALADHPLDRVRHRVDVDDDPGRERDRVALGRVEREAELAELAHDRRGGDVERRLARRDEPAAQAAEELLVPDRVGVLELELAGEPEVGAGLGEQPLGLGEHLVEPPAVPADRRPLARLELACRVDDRHQPVTLSRRRAALGRSWRVERFGDSVRAPTGGRSWPMPSITTSSAPGIAPAVASPPVTSISASSDPWMTTVGVRELGAAPRCGPATRRSPVNWRAVPSGW